MYDDVVWDNDFVVEFFNVEMMISVVVIVMGGIVCFFVCYCVFLMFNYLVSFLVCLI